MINLHTKVSWPLPTLGFFIHWAHFCHEDLFKKTFLQHVFFLLYHVLLKKCALSTGNLPLEGLPSARITDFADMTLVFDYGHNVPTKTNKDSSQIRLSYVSIQACYLTCNCKI